MTQNMRTGKFEILGSHSGAAEDSALFQCDLAMCVCVCVCVSV